MFNFRHLIQSGQSGQMHCPVCRQQVTIIFPCFNQTATTNTADENTNNGEQTTPTDTQTMLQEINLYNRRYSGEPRPVNL